MASVYTALEDDCNGTPGATVTGGTPAPVPNGSDVRGPGLSGGLVYAAGGGIISTASDCSTDWPMTGLAGGIGTYTWVLEYPGSSAGPLLYLRTDPGGGLNNLIQVSLNYSANNITLLEITGGTVGVNTNYPFTLVPGTVYTAVIVLNATDISLSINGTPVFTAVTVPAVNNSRFYYRDSGGSAGQVKLHSIKVTVPGPTTGSFTGPATGTTGAAAGPYAITLGQPVPSVGSGLPVALADAAGSSTFAGASVSGSTQVIPPGATVASGGFTVDRSISASGDITPSFAGVTFTPASITLTTFAPLAAGTLTSGTPTATTATASIATNGGGTGTYSSQLQVSPHGANTWVNNGSPVAGAAPSLTATGLTPATQYDLRATVADTGSGGATTNVVTITTLSTSGATAYTLADASPPSGYVANPSANLAVQANGTPSPSLVVTPSDGSGGAFSPSTLTIADASPRTFQYTPASPGTKTISVVHSGGGFSGDPAPVSYTAIARTLAVSPGSVNNSSSGTLAFTAGGAKWLTGPPSFGPAGVSGFSLGSVTVVDDTHATAPYTTSSAVGTETFTDSTTGATAGVAVVVTTSVTWQTGVSGFATGLVGGTTSGFGYKVGVNGGAFGSLITTGITEDSPGSYSAQPAVAAGAIPRMRWTDGSGGDATDVSPVALPGGGGGGTFPAQAPPNWIARASFAFDAISDGTMRAASSGQSVFFDPTDRIANALPDGPVNQFIYITGQTGLGQVVPIASATGPSGAKVGVVEAGYTLNPALDATSSYSWTGEPTTASGGSGPGATAQAIADAVLTRDWTRVVPEVPDRCALQAFRFLRNAWSTTTNSLTVTAEDDVSTAWTKPLITDSDALPVTGLGGD